MGFNDEGLGEAMRNSARQQEAVDLDARLSAVEMQVRIVDAAQNVMMDQMQAMAKLLLDVITKQEAGK
jgi:hypothetical protein